MTSPDRRRLSRDDALKLAKLLISAIEPIALLLDAISRLFR